MILLWITLLLLHQGCGLIPVTIVQLGESATFTCVYPDWEHSNTRVKWYKQSVGDSLTLITTLLKGTENPAFEKGFPHYRFNVKHLVNMSSLTILKTIQDDKAMYHCAVTTWIKDEWTSTYLSLEGNTLRATNVTVVQWPTLSDPVHPGDSATLQCSVLSDSENKKCPGEHSVYWFGVRSDTSYPNIIYTVGNEPNECKKTSDTQKSCVYHLSKNFNSSDAGIYYCAVATCGEIVFGDGTKLNIEGTGLRSFGDLQTGDVFLLLPSVVSAISVIVIAILIHAIKKSKCDYCHDKAAVSLQENVAKINVKRNEDPWMYSTVVFTVMETSIGVTKEGKAAKRERIYDAAKAF
ncbi:uncharacterized protein LOC117541050 isoform X3 [Gymnodraco acuticeps]|uniref:Uncharacterized protein LOC117541050 isoform X3 n=1 Tax=Gymnodraco acuticeps TaxID=8218 RepID=A0A6P8TIY7_GYMAC|nr:uncharacterized protein LOC117541050 isoform X3 [Gymnodraco acuticeps]